MSHEPNQPESMLFRISNVFLTFHFFFLFLEFFRVSDALAYGETFQSHHFLCLLQMDSMPYVALGALIASPLLAFRFIAVCNVFVVVSSCISLVASYLWLWYEIYCKYLIYPYFSNSGESCSNSPIRIARANHANMRVHTFAPHSRVAIAAWNLASFSLMWIYDIVSRLPAAALAAERNEFKFDNLNVCVWCVVRFGFCVWRMFVWFDVFHSCFHDHHHRVYGGPVKMGPFLFYCHLKYGLV